MVNVPAVVLFIGKPNVSERILAQATVDDLGQGNWSVEVNGHDHRRIYTLRAKDDKTAAFEGIERFTEEMEVLGDASNGDG